jgi:putative flippase GtrA
VSMRAIVGDLTWRRWFTFSTVGLIGLGVQILCLWLLAGVLRLDAVLAAVAATELTVLHNFVWHLRWTWADRPSSSVETLRRLLRFNVSNGGISIIGGAAMMALLVRGLSVHYLVANLISVAVCSVANLIVSDIWAFRPAGREGRRVAAILRRIERDGLLAFILAPIVPPVVRPIVLPIAPPVAAKRNEESTRGQQ